MRKRQRATRKRNNSGKPNARPRLFGHIVTGDTLYRAGIAALTVALLFLALLTRVLPQHAPFQIGEVATRQISATRGATYIDTEATQAARQQAADAVEPVLKTEPQADPNADILAKDTVTFLFDAVRKARADDTRPTQRDKIAAVRENIAIGVSDSSLSILVRCSEDILPYLEAEATGTVQFHMAQGILREELDTHRRQIAEEVAAGPIDQWHRPAVIEIAQTALRYNRILDVDQEKTEAAKRAAADAVPAVERTIVPGEMIIAQGEKVTQLHVDKFRGLGLIRPEVNYAQGVAVAVIVACLVLLFGLYLRERAPEVYASRAQLLFAAACIIVPVSVSQFAVRYGVFPAVAMSAVSFGAMVLSALLALNVAVMGSLVMGMLCGVAASPSDPRIMIATTVAGIVGAFAVSFVARRTQVAVRAALITAGANTIVLLAANGAFGLRMVFNNFFFTILGGIVAGVFAVIAVGLCDRLLGTTTDIRLAELANPNSPLLRRLMEEAPGTYMSS
ncbi:MAG: hypothetical protein ACE5JM_09630, partial [Armatimonadota bacterium]